MLRADAVSERRLARDGEEFAVRSSGVLLISNDGERWGLHGPRPQGDESAEQTPRLEICEETCAIVGDARLLGFCRSVCLTGPKAGYVE
jgi:hypothetical protein